MGQSVTHMAQIIDRKVGNVATSGPSTLAGLGQGLSQVGIVKALPSLECVTPVKASQPPPQ